MSMVDLIIGAIGGKDGRACRQIRRIAHGTIHRHASHIADQDAADFSFFAARRSPYRDALYADFSEFEQMTFRAVYGYVEASAEAAVALMRAVEYIVRNDIGGAFVECGVYKGGNIAIMIRVLQHFGLNDRDLFLYDTFDGMPRPIASDDIQLVGDGWFTHYDPTKGDNGSHWMRADIEAVRTYLAPLRYPQQRLHFVKGMVEDTIPAVAPDQIALLRLDTDFYPSTKHELAHLFPRLAPGGILIVDDYGAFPGCKRAVDEYQQENGTRLFLNRVDPHVRLAIKTQ